MTREKEDRIVSGRQQLIKELNRNLLIKLVVRYGQIGRAELAKLTGLSLPSVMRITEGLLADGLLQEIGKGASSGGRKPSLLTLKNDAWYSVGVEIALKTTVVLADLAGNILDRWDSGELAETAPEQMLENIDAVIWALLETHRIPMDRFAGIGIGTPGSNFKHLHAMELSILRGWEQTDVRGWFEARRRGAGYRILTENVARTRTLNELWFGLGRQYKSFLYVFADQGVGSCFVSGETLQTGHNGVAGEFGHTVIRPGGRPCYCGNAGCMEMYVSAGAITREARRLMGPAEGKLTFSQVLAASDRPEIRAVLEEAGVTLGYGLANLINLFNPRAVILGGEVPKASALVAETAMATAREAIFSRSAAETPMAVSTIPKAKDCLGSVALVINDLFKSVEI